MHCPYRYWEEYPEYFVWIDKGIKTHGVWSGVASPVSSKVAAELSTVYLITTATTLRAGMVVAGRLESNEIQWQHQKLS
jgi:hypothetical protein